LLFWESHFLRIHQEDSCPCLVAGSLHSILGAVAELSELHTSNGVGSGTGLALVTATFGPRYAWAMRGGRLSRFGQGLFGEANGLNGVFPAPQHSSTTADSLALQAGGGLNVQLSNRIGFREAEAEWLRTQLPNLSTNIQKDIHLGTGLVFRVR
jgi:hypothetical protein